MQAIVILMIVCLMSWLIYQAWSIYRTRFSSLRDSENSRYAAFVAEAQSAGPSAVVANVRVEAPGARGALLDAAERIVYFNLKLTLPDHEILARVDPAALTGMASVIPPRAMLDFVVCRKDFTPAAVIMLVRSTDDDPLRERAAQQLAQTGLRVLRWPVAALPKRQEMRAAVLGMAAV